MLESELKTGLKKYLRQTGWFTFQIHQQGFYSYAGISDLIAVKDGIVLFIEVKIEKRKQMPDQVKFQHDLEEHGGIYLLVRSLDDLITQVQEVTKEKISLFG